MNFYQTRVTQCRERQPVDTEHGKLSKVAQDLWVLKLSGSHKERGYIHGKLLAAEILDCFEFFSIEIVLKSKRYYVNTVRPHHIENVRF